MAKAYRKRGGDIIFAHAPLLKEFECVKEAADGVNLTKSSVVSGVRENQLPLIDSGKSERFGCRFDEFIDGYYSVPGCYQKANKHFWTRQLNKEYSRSADKLKK